MTQPSSDQHRRKVLLTSLGVPRTEYKESVYTFNGGEHKTTLAPVASAVLNDLRDALALVLVTPGAKASTLPELENKLPAELKLEVRPINIKTLRDETEIHSLLECLAENTPENADLFIDITHGLRHLPFIYHAAAHYLVALKNIGIAKILYGAFDLKDDKQRVPLIDITGTLRLSDGAHALRNAAKYGNLRELAELLKDDVTWMFKTGAGSPALSPIRDALPSLAANLSNGLPLKVGRAAYSLNRSLQTLSNTADLNIPTSTLAAATLKPLAGDLAACTELESGKIALSHDELRRQLCLIKTYLDWDNESTALLCLREWLVNFVLWRASETSGPLDWRQRDERHRHGEIALHVLYTRSGDPQNQLSAVQKELATLWDAVCQRRNPLAHAGFGDDEFKDDMEKTRAWLEQCQELLKQDNIDLSLPTSADHLLITPLGLSPGVLFTAVSKLAVDKALIVSSEQGVEAIPEALNKAGKADLPYDTIELKDPHRGFDQAQKYCKQAELRDLLKSFAKITVNITGGTTALQYVVERLAQAAQHLGATVQRVALIDRRSPQQQHDDPYQQGELIMLDDDSESET